MRLALFMAIVLAIVLALGEWRSAGGELEYLPHCQGVSFDEALFVVSRMVEARDAHVFWADEAPRRGIEHLVGDRAWHQGWTDTYERTIALLALTLRGCV
jgi:hypothetical protein